MGGKLSFAFEFEFPKLPEFKLTQVPPRIQPKRPPIQPKRLPIQPKIQAIEPKKQPQAVTSPEMREADSQEHHIIECFRDIRSKCKNIRPNDPSLNIMIQIKWVDRDDSHNVWKDLDTFTNPQAGLLMLEELHNSIIRSKRTGKYPKFRIIQRARAYFLRLQELQTAANMSFEQQQQVHLVDQSQSSIKAETCKTEPESVNDYESLLLQPSVQASALKSKIIIEDLGVGQPMKETATNSYLKAAQQMFEQEGRVESGTKLVRESLTTAKPRTEQRKQRKYVSLSQSPAPTPNDYDASDSSSDSDYFAASQPSPHRTMAHIITSAQGSAVKTQNILDSVTKCACFQLRMNSTTSDVPICTCGQRERFQKVRHFGIVLPPTTTTGSNNKPVFEYYFSEDTGLPVFVLQPVGNSSWSHHLNAADMLCIHPQWTLEAIKNIDRFMTTQLQQAHKEVSWIINRASSPQSSTEISLRNKRIGPKHR